MPRPGASAQRAVAAGAGIAQLADRSVHGVDRRRSRRPRPRDFRTRAGARVNQPLRAQPRERAFVHRRCARSAGPAAHPPRTRATRDPRGSPPRIPARLRCRSWSSMRSRIRPPRACVSRHTYAALTTCPRWRRPVGAGANRDMMSRIMRRIFLVLCHRRAGARHRLALRGQQPPSRRARNGRPTAAISRARAIRRSTRSPRRTSTSSRSRGGLKTDALGPRARIQFPGDAADGRRPRLSTAGSRRAVVALDAATGEMIWMHSEHEGKRGEAAPRQLSGRGLCVLARRRRRAAAHRLRDARLPDGRSRREDRRARRELRQQRHRRSEAGRRPADGSDNRRDRPARHADHREGRDRRRRRAPRGRRAEEQAQRERIHPRLRREDRQAAVDLPHHSARGRVRERHVGKRFVGLHRQRRRLGADDDRRRARAWCTCPSSCRPATTTAAIARATGCSARASSRSI